MKIFTKWLPILCTLFLLSNVAFADNDKSMVSSKVCTAQESLCGEYITIKSSPSHLVMSPIGGKIYITDEAANKIHVFSTVKNELQKAVITSKPTRLAVFSPDGKTAYVTGADNSVMFLIDAIKGIVQKEIDLPLRHIDGLAISEDGSTVFLLDLTSSELYITSAKNLSIIKKVSLSSQLQYDGRIRLFSDSKKVFLPTFGGDFSIVDIAKGELQSAIPKKAEMRSIFKPSHIIWLEAKNTIGGMTLYNLIDNTLSKEIVVNYPSSPAEYVEFSPEGNYAYATSSKNFTNNGHRYDAGVLNVIHLFDGKVEQYYLFDQGGPLIVSNNGKKLYVLGYYKYGEKCLMSIDLEKKSAAVAVKFD